MEPVIEKRKSAQRLPRPHMVIVEEIAVGAGRME